MRPHQHALHKDCTLQIRLHSSSPCKSFYPTAKIHQCVVSASEAIQLTEEAVPESDLMVYDGQEPLDDVVWDRNDDESDQGLKLMRIKTTCRKVEELAARLFNREASLVSPIILGGFNILYRIHLKGRSPDALVRLPCPSLVQFPVEKTAQEAATAKLVAKKTDAPIPLHLFDGEDPDLGPYAIMDYVENNGSVSARLTIPNKDISEPHVLDPYVAEDTLASI